MLKKLFFLIFLFTFYSHGQQINILYTANVNASLEECNCGTEPFGGLDKIKTFAENYKTNNHNTVFIDGGDIFNSYPFSLLNEFVIKSLDILNYDVISPGNNVLLEKQKFVNDFITRNKSFILSSNTNLSSQKKYSNTLNNIDLNIYSFLSPQIFQYFKQPAWLEIDSSFAWSDIKSNTLNILIYHGWLSDLQRNPEIIRSFSLILLSHDQQLGQWQVDKTRIIGCGTDAQYVAVITIKQENTEYLIDASFEKMDERFKKNKNIIALNQEFNRLLEIKLNPDNDTKRN